MLSSPYVSFAPATMTVDATGMPSAVEETIANNAPTTFTAYATPTGSTTPVATTSVTLNAPLLSGYPYEGSYQLSGSCFGPNQPVTITSGDLGVTLPSPVVPDNTGRVTFSIRATASANPSLITISATDTATGRAAQTQLNVPATTLRVGQQMRDSKPTTLVSPDMHYQLTEGLCTLELTHYYVSHGVPNDVG